MQILELPADMTAIMATARVAVDGHMNVDLVRIRASGISDAKTLETAGPMPFSFR